jgi:hypothetical protein
MLVLCDASYGATQANFNWADATTNDFSCDNFNWAVATANNANDCII